MCMIYDEFLEIVEKKYGSGFIFTPWDGDISINTIVECVCPIHGKIEQRISYFTYYDYGCRICYKNAVSDKKYEAFVHKANSIHNNKYEYEKFYFQNTQQKIKIKCPIHGYFEQTIAAHLAGSECQVCGELIRVKKLSCSTEEAIHKYKKVHGDFYDYSLVEYTGVNEYIKIICPIHGVFEQSSQVHAFGSGCKECGKLKNGAATSSRFGYTYDTITKIFNTKHDNKYYYPVFEYINTKQKIDIVCPKHGTFKQSIHSHKNGSGCPRCWFCYNVSKKETDWLDSLSSTITRGVTLYLSGKKIRPDGYDKDTNTVYLFHGSYWHGDPRVYSPEAINKNNKKTMGHLYETTLAHENIYKEHGYNLVVMWEYDWDSIIKGNKDVNNKIVVSNVVKPKTKIQFED